jgi:hypothetical protein
MHLAQLPGKMLLQVSFTGQFCGSSHQQAAVPTRTACTRHREADCPALSARVEVFEVIT